MANPDLDVVFDDLLTFAKQMLAEHGEFYPFAVAMDHRGVLTSIGAQLEGTDMPPSAPLIDLLTSGLRAEAAAGKLRAAGICFDVRITPPGADRPGDAIACAIEHVTGEAGDIFLPYLIHEADPPHYGEAWAQRRTLTIFVASSAA